MLKEIRIMTTHPRWTAVATDLHNLQNQVRSMFEPLARGADEDLVSGNWVPPVDVAETQEKIIVRAEVPGMKQQDIQIEFENGMLTLRGERKLDKQQLSVTDNSVERPSGKFRRSFTP